MRQGSDASLPGWPQYLVRVRVRARVRVSVRARPRCRAGRSTRRASPRPRRREGCAELRRLACQGGRPLGGEESHPGGGRPLGGRPSLGGRLLGCRPLGERRPSPAAWVAARPRDAAVRAAEQP
eukprot:scaffold66583_cov64-Phaeocystis_antarctica.AAC.4